MAKPRNDIEYIEVVVSLHDYEATDATLLSLKKGDYIYVHTKDPSGWWDGTLGDKRGWFPSNYIGPAEVAQPESINATLEKVLDNTTVQIEKVELNDKKDDQQLPPFWRKKQSPSGEVYYFNTQTNQTTYNMEEVLASTPKKRASILFQDNAAVVNTEKKLPNAPLQRNSSWIPGPQSLISEGADVTWELLINNILKSISDLNYSAKNDIKSRYIQECNQIVRAIRDMLACSGTVSAESQIIKSNKSLSVYHSNIMTSLSKIVLAAKVAAGLWPPPDAVHKMRYQAGQVLLAVRHFVAVAQDLNITLQPLMNQEITEFDIRGTAMSDSELLSRLDQNSEIIMATIASLVTQITRDRVLSPALVEKVKKTVVEIGQLMSLIEDIKFQASEDPESLLAEFKLKKDTVYAACNDLVTSASTDDGFAPPNALGMMLETTTAVLESVEEVIVQTKVLIDREDMIMMSTLNNEAMAFDRNSDNQDTSLSLLQRRALSLNFLENEESILDSRKSTASVGSNQSGQWTRDNRVPSTESRFTGSTAKSYSQSPEPFQARKGSISGNSFNSRHSEDFARSPEELGSANKLAKFFGEESVKNVTARNSDTMRPWFLRKENNNDLSFNMEGAVNGGTFSALVERLTVHDQPVDPGYATAFLMTFHLFGTAEQLFDELIGRFMMEPPDGLTPDEVRIWVDKKLQPVQIRVCNAFKAWLENHWIESKDDGCLDNIYSFASGPMMQAQPTLATRLQELVSKRISSDVYGTANVTPKMKRLIRTEDVPTPLLPKNLKRFTLYDLDPTEIARQLTLMESNIFAKIQPIELMKQEWSKKENSLAVNVRQMTQMSTKITGWVVSKILSETDVKRRANCLKFFIKIADRCLSLNNYNTLMALASAFNSSTISRLKKTWDQLSARTKGTFENIKRATDHSRNYNEYRAVLKRTPLPALPFLGLFLTDLTFTDDGNTDMRNNGRLINFDKYAKTAKIIQDLSRYQTAYALAEVAEIQEHLLQSINERGTRDVQELYEISLRLEPREPENAQFGGTGTPEDMHRELEAKIEMLEKAGML
ncbi:ras guanine nucleotide exchange factor domain-containing protein [Gorgonomyces haynaldii]|nr:ras guanine nucleotide exchange factor domain-containing protein [Gorgonomyces haynaldii]